MIAEGVMRINIWPFIHAPLALNFPVTIPPHETASATVPSSHNLSGKDPLPKGFQVLPSPWALPKRRPAASGGSPDAVKAPMGSTCWVADKLPLRQAGHPPASALPSPPGGWCGKAAAVSSQVCLTKSAGGGQGDRLRH